MMMDGYWVSIMMDRVREGGQDTAGPLEARGKTDESYDKTSKAINASGICLTGITQPTGCRSIRTRY